MSYRQELLGLLHDLNNLLVAVVGSLEMVANPRDPHTRALASALRMIQRIRSTEARLRRNGAVEVQTITVEQFLDRVRESAAAAGFPAKLHFKLGEADRRRLMAYSPHKREVIMDNLRSNWTAAGVTELNIVVRLDQLHESLAVELIDDGCGMSAAELAKIRTGPMLGEGEKGKGCQLIRQACAASGRTVSWESIEYVGTKVTIRHQLVNGHQSVPPEAVGSTPGDSEVPPAP